MPDPQRCRDAARNILQSFDHLLVQAQVPDRGEARVAACLALTIFDEFRAAMCLVDGGLTTHAAGPIRGMLEALADLQNLCRDGQYVDRLRFEDARSRVNLFDEIAALPDMPEEILRTLADWNRLERPVYTALRDAGYGRMPVEEKLRRAELGTAYVQYRLLPFKLPCVTARPSEQRGHARKRAWRVAMPGHLCGQLGRTAERRLALQANVVPVDAGPLGYEHFHHALALWHFPQQAPGQCVRLGLPGEIRPRVVVGIDADVAHALRHEQPRAFVRCSMPPIR